MLTRMLSPVFYVTILSATLCLVLASTPEGLITFCNIMPSFIVKVAWPYLLKGATRYRRSVNAEFLRIVALPDGVGMRLFGISVASFTLGPFNCAST